MDSGYRLRSSHEFLYTLQQGSGAEGLGQVLIRSCLYTIQAVEILSHGSEPDKPLTVRAAANYGALPWEGPAPTATPRSP